MQLELAERSLRVGVAGATAAVAGFLLARLHSWPPHEDETLALFVGERPLGELFDTVLGERGGAPLHFLLVHLAAAVSPTLTAARLVSVVFAVASIPLVAALVSRLTDRLTGLAATLLVAASWVTLFHGVYGRMYSLFLFTSLLSFLALLRAVGRNTPASWALWALAVYATLASHQYGAFVLAAQALYVLALRVRGRAQLLPGAVALGAVVAAAVPLWRSNAVLASRYGVGIGEGEDLGSPRAALDYLGRALGDFVAGWTPVFVLATGLALAGLVWIARGRPRSALLALLAFAVPAGGLAVAHAGSPATAAETRHLIFVLPLFAMLVAAGLVGIARRAGSRARALLAVSLAALIALEVAWGWNATPTLFTGEPAARTAARAAAAEWLASTSRRTDVLFAYDPLYLGARERGGRIGRTVVPRADAALALEAVLEAPKPLGRGVWVLDASDGPRIRGNRFERLEIENRSPGPAFETRVFGPFLIIRTLAPTITPDVFLYETARVQALGVELGVAAAPLQYETARVALEQLQGLGRG